MVKPAGKQSYGRLVFASFLALLAFGLIADFLWASSHRFSSAMLSLFPPLSPPWSENFLQVPMDSGSQQRNIGFCGRVVVLSVLSLLLYPFLWGWTVIGTIWFTRAKSCILVDMIRVPDWAFEAAGQELRSMSQDAATYHPGLYLTPAQT